MMKKRFALLLMLILCVVLACCATAQADTQSDLVTVLLNGEEITGNVSVPVKEGDKLRLEFRKCPFSVDIALSAGSTDDLDAHGITLDSVADADVVTQEGYVYEYTFGPPGGGRRTVWVRLP